MRNENLVKETNGKPAEPENYATEVLRTFLSFAKFIIGFLIISLAASVILAASLYVWNDQKWRDLFNSYDYISQDGEGINNINSGDQGSLNNGSEE